MIDFRYHLVSLVSVFIALAIGVVLGAGPLGGTLGDTLNQQITGLREDKTALQQAVNNRDATITAQDNALTAVAPDLVANTLTGHTVSIVVLPGTNTTRVDATRALLDDSGAVVVSTAELHPTWYSPDGTAAREPALAAAPEAETDSQRLAALLASSIATTSPSGAPGEDAQPALDALTGAGLATITRSQPVRADFVVLLVPGPQDASTDAELVKAQSETGLDLTTAFAGQAGRVVVAGPTTSAETGVIAAVRGSRDVQDRVYTVDDLENAAGPLGIAFALAQPAGSTPLHFGVTKSAAAVLPSVPEPVTSPAPAATP